MQRETARLILHQLVEARRILQEVARGNASQDAANAYFFRFVAVSKTETDDFFASETGQKIAAQFKV